jgi:DNA-binding transcriptional MerR regulator
VDGVTDERYRIGEAARMAGVSTRTLRYYQELGLVHPAASSPGGNRLYSEVEVVRLRRIIELREVMGLDLGRIGEILRSEDRLDEIRAEAAKGPTSRRRHELILEALELNAHMQEQVAEKLTALQSYLDDLTATAARYRGLLAELDAAEASPA